MNAQTFVRLMMHVIDKADPDLCNELCEAPPECQPGQNTDDMLDWDDEHVTVIDGATLRF